MVGLRPLIGVEVALTFSASLAMIVSAPFGQLRRYLLGHYGHDQDNCVSLSCEMIAVLRGMEGGVGGRGWRDLLDVGVVMVVGGWRWRW